MSDAFLDIHPFELQFHFELKKRIFSSQHLTNKTDNYVAFNVKTTNSKNYFVDPNIGVLLPRSSIEVVVTMHAQHEVPADMQCKDKFLFQCFVASPGTKEVTHEMFKKGAGNRVEETKLMKVVYVDRLRPAYVSNKLLDIDPIDLQFHFELNKQISCSQYLTNKTDNYVAFKVKVTNPKNYTVNPCIGVVHPRSSIEVLVTMREQNEVPVDMQCKDKFLLQCVVASPGTNAREVTDEMFSKEAGNRVEETKLRVVYLDPPRPVREGSLPSASVSDKGNASEQLKHGSNRSQSGAGNLIYTSWYISARGLRRRTVKGGEVAIQS